MSGESIQFVDTISTSAVVRMDLNLNGWSVLQNGTDVSPPSFNRATVSTLLVDGDSIPASAYGNRVIKLHLQLRNQFPENNAVQMQKLWRELDRTRNVLKWQPDPAISPVYFRTYRSPDFEPQIFDHGIELFDLIVSLVAEPFSYGPLELLSTVTVQSDPTVTQGKYLDVTGVKGDVETPAILKFVGADLDTSTLLPWQMVLGMRRRGTPSNMVFTLQAESMTLGTNSALYAAGANFSPTSGNNAIAVNFGVGDNLYDVRASAYFPTTSNVEMRGTYRVFARVSLTNPGIFNFILKHGARGVNNDPVTFTNTATGGFVDLGLVQFPEGADPGGIGYANDAIPAPIPLSVMIQRTSTSGTAYLDYLMFVPADDAIAFISSDHNLGGGPQNFIFDGVKRMIYGVDSFGQIADVSNAYYNGGELMLSPNQTNRIIVIRSLGMNYAAADVASSKVDITVSYYPRYIYVRPLST